MELEKLVSILKSNKGYKIIQESNGTCHVEVNGKDITGSLPVNLVNEAASKAASGLILG